jgi:hypothetical protein
MVHEASDLIVPTCRRNVEHGSVLATVTQSAANVNHMAPVNIIQSAADVMRTSSVNIQRGADVIPTTSVNINQRAVSILRRLCHSVCRRCGAHDAG